jgi:hypothetical protein
MIDNNHELTIGELDAVSGGMLEGLLGKIVNEMQKAGGSGEPGPGGGQNDPAQMFQQILQQLTRGQG